MWNYERRLEYPVNITRCNPQAAMVIMSQYGGLYSITCRMISIATILLNKKGNRLPSIVEPTIFYRATEGVSTAF